MKKLLLGLSLFSSALMAQTKISQLPLASAATTGTSDSLPFVSASAELTERLLLTDLINIPAFQTEFSTLIPSQTGNSGKCLSTSGTATQWISCGAVTSVGLTVPSSSILSVTGSPITSSGTFAVSTTGTSGGIPYFSSSSQLSTSAALTANAIVLGGGAGTSPSSLGSLGTTTTVLHGNASGAPTFGAVNLGTDTTGTLSSSQVATSTFVAPTTQRFTSGSGTYTTPTSPRSPLYIEVEMVGGGGGGNGSGTSSPAGGAGGNTTFASNTASGGGVGATTGSLEGGGGGSTSVGTGTTLFSVVGGTGGGGQFVTATNTVSVNSGAGGVSCFGGSGGPSGNGQAGNAGATSSGSGGSGGAATGTSFYNGAGGGAGGCQKVIISSPAASYSYGVGAAGTAGSAGSSGYAGGAGGSGVVIVREFYQ